jgi:hypothetical protein
MRVEEPSKKRKSTEDELNYFKDYDKKRKRQNNSILVISCTFALVQKKNQPFYCSCVLFL